MTTLAADRATDEPPVAAGEIRLRWVDAMRGFAVVLMVPANFTPYLAEPHPLWFRVVASFAAPAFVMVSAGMAVLTARRHRFRDVVVRGACIVLVGMLVDVLIWGILPWTSFDVLYLIGIALPLAYLLRHASAARLLLAAVVIVALAAGLRGAYDAEVLQIALVDPYLPRPGRLLQSWLLDGWFPILPWLAFAFIGVAWFRPRLTLEEPPQARRLLPGAALLILGLALLLGPVPPELLGGTMDQVLESRSGYSEIFYPATPAFIIAATGFVLCATALLRMEVLPAWLLATLAFFGRYAMMVYVLHLAFGAYLIGPALRLLGVPAITSAAAFLLVTVAALALTAAICGIAGRLKRRHPPSSTLLRVLVGR